MSIGVGPIGVWISSSIWRGREEALARSARTIEELGFGAIWLGGASADLAFVERILGSTDRIVVATGIVNIWANPASALAASFGRLSGRYADRVLLGLGVGHKVRLQALEISYQRPYEAMCRYLDELDAFGLPREHRVLAALGPKVLALARDRAAGAHPFLVTPSHTATARTILGPSRLLAPEQGMVLMRDAASAREIARARIAKHLALANYRKSLLRQGFTAADLSNGGSDQLIDRLVAQGDPESAFQRVSEHRAAGADHVTVQMLTARPEIPAAEWRSLATQLRGIAIR